MAIVKKQAAKIKARMQQKQHDQAERAGSKRPARKDDDDDDDGDQSARRDQGGGVVVGSKTESAGATAGDEDDDDGEDDEAVARAATAPRRRRSVSPAPAEGRLGPEQPWSKGFLFRLDGAEQRHLGMQKEVAFNEMAPSSRKTGRVAGSGGVAGCGGVGAEKHDSAFRERAVVERRTGAARIDPAAGDDRCTGRRPSDQDARD